MDGRLCRNRPSHMDQKEAVGRGDEQRGFQQQCISFFSLYDFDAVVRFLHARQTSTTALLTGTQGQSSLCWSTSCTQGLADSCWRSSHIGELAGFNYAHFVISPVCASAHSQWDLTAAPLSLSVCVCLCACMAVAVCLTLSVARASAVAQISSWPHTAQQHHSQIWILSLQMTTRQLCLRGCGG